MISNDRKKHIFSVARKMKEIVADNLDKYTITPDEAYLLGYLHDVGYEFCEIQSDHAHKGGYILKEQGYKYWKEIYLHGEPQEEYFSRELLLLNYVDMTTSLTGKDITIQERIEDISKRYGEDSIQTINAIKMKKIIDKLYE